MKVELESGVWLADGEGDPARTLVEENAAEFVSMQAAMVALSAARAFRPFKNALIHDDLF